MINEIWYDYIEPKYHNNAKLCYMDTDSFTIQIETKDFYKDITNDVKRWFDTSNQEDDRALPRGMNKNIIRLFKDGLRGKIRVELVAFRPKTYSYLIHDDSEHKKVKETKKCVIKTELKFKNEIIWKLQQRFKNEAHNVYAEQINKFVLSSNDDKRLQTFDRITTYPY